MQDGSNNPIVSIIIPAFNAENYINETISSVLQQSLTNWELIIINDGSTDGTLKVCESIAKSDKRIIVVTKQNSGVSETRNKGIELAKGEFISFLDADDIWLPDNLLRKIQLLNQDPELGFVYSNMFEADMRLQNKKIAAKGKDKNIFEDLLMWNGEVIPGPCSNIVVRKKCLDVGIRFDKRLTTIADQNFTVQLAHQFKGKLIEDALWIYRILPGSMSKSIAVMEKDAIATYNIYKEKKFFVSNSFKRKCFASMYLIISGSWFKDGKNFSKGLQYLIKALLESPGFTVSKLVKKLVKKII